MAKVFFSYAHEDERLRDQLEKHLSLLKREGVIETWHDRRIGAGRPFADEIDSALEASDIVLLLVSANGLRYSSSGVGNGSGFNESLSVENDGYLQFWKPMGMASISQKCRGAANPPRCRRISVGHADRAASTALMRLWAADGARLNVWRSASKPIRKTRVSARRDYRESQYTDRPLSREQGQTSENWRR